MTREEIIAKLAGKFGHHTVPELRKGSKNVYELVPSGRDEMTSTVVSFAVANGYPSIRTLTYGEIADALCDEDGREGTDLLADREDSP